MQAGECWLLREAYDDRRGQWANALKQPATTAISGARDCAPCRARRRARRSGRQAAERSSRPVSRSSCCGRCGILVGLLAVYAVIFVVLNLDEVDINFVFFSARISLFIAILLLLGIGFAGGYLTHGLRSRRRAGNAGR